MIGVSLHTVEYGDVVRIQIADSFAELPFSDWRRLCNNIEEKIINYHTKEEVVGNGI